MKTKCLLLALLLPLTFMVSSCGDDPAPAGPTGGFNFSAANNDLRAPTEITFNADDEIAGATFAWDFGDGTTSTDKSPKKVFNTGGSKLIKLTVTSGTTVKSETKTVALDGGFTKVTITGIKVVGYQASYPDGTGWDVASTGTAFVTGAPDMFILGRLAGQSTDAIYSSIKTNVSPAQVTAGSINWTTPYTPGGLYSKVFSASDLGTVLSIYLQDSDDGNTLWTSVKESMGLVTIKFSDYMTLSNKYPASATLQGSGSTSNNALKLELTLKWE